MGAYKGEIVNTAQATGKTLGTLAQPASALKRLKLTYLSLGSSASADNQNYAQLKRTTASNVSGAVVTPTQADAADGAASGLITAANTSEPTYSGGSLLSPTFHQRSSYQWYAQPGHEIVIPLTNNAGLGVFMNTMSATIALDGLIEWEE